MRAPQGPARTNAAVDPRAPPAQARTSALVEKINGNTLMVLHGRDPGLTYGAMAADLATVLNDGDNFRILPVAGAQCIPRTCATSAIFAVGRYGFHPIQPSRVTTRRKGLIGDLAEKIVYVVKNLQ